MILIYTGMKKAIANKIVKNMVPNIEKIINIMCHIFFL